jgi:alpha-tubulin suppressor-like RCC1 family protein
VGQLGTGDTVPHLTPVAVDLPPGVAIDTIVAGTVHTCGLSAGQAYCWGSDMPNVQHGVQAVSQPAGVTFTSLTAGERMTCGLTAGGQAYCWGFNFFGELGDSTTTDRATPAPVHQPAGVAFATLSSSFLHVCGVTGDGHGYCWGSNALGELGDGGSTQRTVPAQVVAAGGATFARLVAGWYYTCGLTASGQAYCWGSNQSGQLGGSGRVTPSPDVPFTALAAAGDHTCALTAGAAYCWGGNDRGQLGDGTFSPRVGPVAVAGTR